MIDVEKTIINQYDRFSNSNGQYTKSVAINNLVDLLNQWIDPRDLIDKIYNKIWNIETASGFGLDIIGRIVGVSRETIYKGEGFFGFSEALDLENRIHPFNQRPFYVRDQTSGGTTLLNDHQYRKMIYIRAMANITNLTAESMNNILLYIFSERDPYVEDLGEMAIRCVLKAPITQYESFLISTPNVIPRPAGVSISFVLV